MESTVEAVGRVIETMRENLGEQLTVDDMARSVMFSKFHFSRFFQKVTGVSPGRFLSAMRLHEAKELLLTTSLTVTEISHQVGYASVGTFSSRFTMSVGVPPTTYRQLGGFDRPVLPAVPRPAGPSVRGQVLSPLPDADLGTIFVGLFGEPIPQRQPVRCAVLHRTGSFVLDEVPHGTWYVLAHSVAGGLEAAVSADGGGLEPNRTLCVGSSGRLRVGPESRLLTAEIRLEPLLQPDSDLIKALLDIRSVALTVGAA